MEKNELRLSVNQTRALTALLKYPTIGEAAEDVGLSPRTIRRYMAEPDFRAALADAEAEAVTKAAQLAAGTAAEAVMTLVRVMRDPNAEDKDRRQAANALLNHLPKLRLMADLERRLAEIERLLEDEE